MKNLRFMMMIVSIAMFAISGCALPPPDTTRQSLVPEKEIQAVRYTKEGLSSMREGRYLDAEMQFEKALRLQPDAEAVRTNIAVSLFMQERFDEALEMFRKLESGDPGSLVYKLWMGRTLVKAGRGPEGMAFLNEGLDLAVKREDWPSASSFARTISVIQFERGFESDALCSSSSAYLYAPTAEEAVRHARVLVSLGYPQNAAVFLQGMFGTSLDIPVEARLIFAEAAIDSHSLESAVDFLQDALLMNPQDPDTQYEMKLLVLILGKELEKKGVHSDLSVLESDTENSLVRDTRAQGAKTLQYPAFMLRGIESIRASQPKSLLSRFGLERERTPR